MTIKVFISGICGSHEVRKQQQRVLFILQSLPIDLQVVDITEPGRDEDLNFMQEEAKKHDKKTQLPPQIFNGTEYCGDYADFELSNDDDEIMKFLKLEAGPLKGETLSNAEPITQNGINHHNDKEVLDSMEQDSSNEINDSNVTNEQDIELTNTEITSDDKDAENENTEDKPEAVEESVEEAADASAADKKSEESAEEESEEESE